jgi:hypothetical protein
MGRTLQDVLGYENLTGLINDPKGGVPADVLPPAFLNTTRTIQGQTGTYRKVSSTRKTARMVEYSDPSVRRNLTGVSEVPFKCIHAKEHVIHDATTLTQLTNFTDANMQALGKATVAMQTAEFARLFNNLRVSSIYSVFRYGIVYFDADGNLLPSATSALATVDMQVPAGNKDQLDILGGGDLISADWSTAGTDINQDIINIKSAALKKNGYPLAYAFYGSSILQYLIDNTSLKNLINGNPGFAQAFLQGDIPDGFMGLKWRPAYDMFYEDADGTIQSWFPSDFVTFTPEPSPDWWEVVQGTYPVPRSVGNVAGDAMALLSQVAAVPGKGSYAFMLPDADPVGIKHVGFDTFLAIPKVPSCIYIGNTVA